MSNKDSFLSQNIKFRLNKIYHKPIKYILSFLLFVWIINTVYSTIDINEAELQYLSDHLSPEECRKLVAAAHVHTYEAPTNLDEGETKIPKDLSCFELLLHWNSAKGEGRGESHELLQHRLRQIDKGYLADWLGKTVFHELAVDLNESLSEGLKEVITQTEEAFPQPTLPPVIFDNAREWEPIDSIFYAIGLGLVVTFIIACSVLCYKAVFKRNKKKNRSLKQTKYEQIENETSGSESEDKFDIRNFKINTTINNVQ